MSVTLKSIFFFTHLERSVEIVHCSAVHTCDVCSLNSDCSATLHCAATPCETVRIVTELLKREAGFEHGKMMELYGLSMQRRPDTSRTPADQNP